MYLGQCSTGPKKDILSETPRGSGRPFSVKVVCRRRREPKVKTDEDGPGDCVGAECVKW